MHIKANRQDTKIGRQIPGSEYVLPARREFLRSAFAGAVAASFCGTVISGEARAQSSSPLSPGVLFEGYALPVIKNNVYEATLAGLNNGQYWLLFVDKQYRLVRQPSTDGGRTWEAAQPVLGRDGSFIGSNGHASLLHLKSGALGMVYCGFPFSRPGRDGPLLFRTSDDGGKSWSAAIAIEPLFGVCAKGTARVLRTGRIVAPSFIWISSMAGNSSGATENSATVTWVFYSDDEGQTWHRSLSELFVSANQGRLGFYDFEEPSLEELNDGSLLMFGRTELGRFYQTVSKDGGVSWSDPIPGPLAASYTPPYLVRIPSTNDILTVWNQASAEEIVDGLSRHRLSTAISSDGGATWRHFRNLESLDDRTYVDPPPSSSIQVYRPERRPGAFQEGILQEPKDQHRYPHAPGCVRICYPSATFGENEVTFAYDYGRGGPGTLYEGSTTKIKIVSLDWLYERV